MSKNIKEDSQSWYVLKGENKYGPFSYAEMVKMACEDSIHEHDYIWTKGMAKWEKIAMVKQFSSHEMKRFLNSQEAKQEQNKNQRRKHVRSKYGASLLVHNNKRVWKGESLEISAGGAHLVFDSQHFNIGDTLFLHFKPGDGVPPFNAICSVVTQRKENNKTSYGVKFTNINSNIQKEISEFVKKSVA